MLKYYFGFIGLLLYITTSAQNQSNRIIGLLIDQITRAPIEGAIIKIKSDKSIIISTEEGRFYIRHDYHATDSIIISAIGYEEKILSLNEVLELRTLNLKKQEVILEEVVVAGRSNPTQLISKIDIKVKGINNSQEVLRFVPGLFIGQHAGGGKAEQIFLRGFDIDHGTDINIEVDGMPVNMVSHAHGQGYADLHFVIPELIQDVQFEKGTYNASKGNFATAGFVDFKTKKRISQSAVKVEAGLFNTFRNVVLLDLLNKEKEVTSWYVAGEFMHTRGYFDHPQNFHRLNLFSKYVTTLGAKNELTISTSLFKSKWNASGQIPERSVNSGAISFFGAIDPNEGGNTSRANLNFQLVTNLNGSSSIKNQLYFTNYKFDLFSNFTFFLNEPVDGDQIRQKEKRNLFGYNSSFHNVHYIGNRRLTSEMGLNMRLDYANNSELTRTKNRLINLKNIKLGHIRDINMAAYISESIQWNRLITINAGARVDNFIVKYTDMLNNNKISKSSKSIISPKLNVYIHPNDRTEFYISTGKGFHSNDTRVVVFSEDENFLPAAYSADLGVNFKMAKNIFINAAVWNLFLDQEFIYVGDEGVVEPGGKTVRKGFDVTIRYQPFKKIFIDADINYAYARLKDEPKGQNFLPLAPAFTSTGGVMYKTSSGFNSAIRYRYMSSRPANEENSVVAKGYFITDLSANYTKEKFEVSLSIQNIFNNKWKETQFETESRLRNEPLSVSEIHFTPGTPLFVKVGFTYFF